MFGLYSALGLVQFMDASGREEGWQREMGERVCKVGEERGRGKGEVFAALFYIFSPS